MLQGRQRVSVQGVDEAGNDIPVPCVTLHPHLAFKIFVLLQVR